MKPLKMPASNSPKKGRRKQVQRFDPVPPSNGGTAELCVNIPEDLTGVELIVSVEELPKRETTRQERYFWSQITYLTKLAQREGLTDHRTGAPIDRAYMKDLVLLYCLDNSRVDLITNEVYKVPGNLSDIKTAEEFALLLQNMNQFSIDYFSVPLEDPEPYRINTHIKHNPPPPLPPVT